MKKSLTLITLLGLMTTSLLQAQTAYSNIVGMIKHDIAPGEFKILSLQFPDGASGVTLGEAFSDLPDRTTIFTWGENGGGYSSYEYYEGFGWFDTLTTLNVDSKELAQGTAFWIRDPGTGSSPVQSGGIPTTESFTVNVTAGFNLFANPYPVPLTLSSLDVSQLSDRDKIFYWNGSGYQSIEYYVGFGWYDVLTAQPADDFSIPAGEGFWLSAADDGIITFITPITD
jgi:hypothetical protein